MMAARVLSWSSGQIWTLKTPDNPEPKLGMFAAQPAA